MTDIRVSDDIERWAFHGEQWALDTFPDHYEREPWHSEAWAAYDSNDVRKMMAFSACANPGKTCWIALAGWHFLQFSRMRVPGLARGVHPKGKVVSETEELLKTTLWPEFALWRARSPAIQAAFEQTSSLIYERHNKDSWWLATAAYSRSGTPDEQGRTLAGVHGPLIFLGLDETGMMPPVVGKTARQALFGEEVQFGRVVISGNPISRKGLLYDATVTQRERFHVIKITGDPDNPNRCTRINLENARAEIAAAPLGRDDPWIKVSILGEFPDADFNALLSPEDVERAMARVPQVAAYDFAPRILGVDVAFEGNDRTVILRRQGCMVWPPLILRGLKPDQIAARVVREWEDFRADACFVDGTGGFGLPVVRALEQIHYPAVGVQFGGTPDDPQFANKRAEMWIRMRDAVLADLALPRGTGAFMPELTEPTYTRSLHSGKVLIEEKAQIKKRLKLSPDVADALALTFAHMVAPRRDPRHPLYEPDAPVADMETSPPWAGRW